MRKYTLLYILFIIILYFIINYFKLSTLEYALSNHMQILDIPELIKSPVDSILQLHSQPPLLNTVIYFLSLINDDVYKNFLVLNILLSAGVSIIIIYVLDKYYDNKITPILFGICYLISPSTLLNITYPFYPVLTSFGYAILILSFTESKYRKNLSIILFIMSTSYLTLLRSSFSLVHVLIVCALYLFVNKKNITDKIVWLSIVLCILISLLVPIKNKIMYDFFGTSSWASLNIAKGVGIELISLNNDALNKIQPPLQCAHNYGIQDTNLTKSNGENNFNSCIIMEYSKLVKDSISNNYNLKVHLKHISFNAFEYLSPPEKYFALKNYFILKDYSNLFNYLFITIDITESVNKLRNLLFNTIVDINKAEIFELRLLLIILIISSIFLVNKNSLNINIFLLIICLHFLTHVLTDGGESRRFVFDLEFLFYILFGVYFSYASRNCLNVYKFFKLL